MIYIVRIDMPDHPDRAMRSVHWLFGETGVTKQKANARRFTNDAEALVAAQAFWTHWRRLNPRQRYEYYIEEYAVYKIRWVVRARFNMTSRGCIYGRPNGHYSASRNREPLLWTSRDEADVAAEEWLRYWRPSDTSVEARVTARRIRL